MNRIRFIPSFVATGLLLSSTALYAQTVDMDIPESPLDEAMEYLPDAAVTLGVGGVAGVRYKDNVYRAANNEESDAVGLTIPRIRLKGDMQPLKLQLDTKFELAEYASETRNNYSDVNMRGGLEYSLSGVSALYADGRFDYDHVDIGAFSDDPQQLAANPTKYRYTEAGGGWKLDSASWIGKLDLRSLLYNYNNVDRAGGGRFINDDRDFDQQNLTARAGYKFWQDTALYLEGGLNQRNYGNRIDASLNQAKDSDGYEAYIGLMQGDVRDGWFVDVAVGTMDQNYDDAGMPDVNMPAVRAMLQWQPYSKMRVRAEASRQIREQALLDTSSYLMSRARLRAEYEFAPQWTVGGGLRYTENDFQVNPLSGRSSRIDHIWDGGVSLDYALTPEYSLGGEVMRMTRRSDNSQIEFDANVAMLRLKMNY